MTKLPYIENTSLMTDHYKVNKVFMTKIIEAKKSVNVEAKSLPDSPTELTRDEAKLRLTLLVEEVLEAIDAAGFELNYDGDGKLIVEPVEGKSFNLVEFVDACADIDVINTGNLIQCGVPDALVKELVNENNLAKFGPGHTIRGDGKLMKPPNHEKPNFEGFIKFLTNPPLVIQYKLEGITEYGELTGGYLQHTGDFVIRSIDIARSILFRRQVTVRDQHGLCKTFCVVRTLYGDASKN